MDGNLVARGVLAECFDGTDRWTDKATNEAKSKSYRAFVVNFSGGRHIIREPYSSDEGVGAKALNEQLAGIKPGEAVAVSVRLNKMGRLELAGLSGSVRKESAAA